MSRGKIGTEPSASAVPTKCVSCQALQQVPFACEDCHQLLAHVQGADYFELFGLPQTYDLDAEELAEKHLTISRNIHPDRFATAGEEMQAFALRGLAAVNQAYDVLRDPIHRAEYLLESAGGTSAAQDKRVPEDLLAQVMMIREEIEEAKAGDDGQAIEALRGQILQRKQASESAIAGLCRQLNEATDETKDNLRLQLNAMKYINNLLAQL